MTDEPNANVLLTNDGAFAVMPDGSRVRLPDSISNAVGHTMLCDSRHGNALGSRQHDATLCSGEQEHGASDPTRASSTSSPSQRARTTGDHFMRNPVTGRFKRLKGDTPDDVKADESLTYAERMTRREIVRCLRARGWSRRQSLARAMTYIQAERMVNDTRGLRGDVAAIAASDALHAAMLCDAIWLECGHDKLAKRDDPVTETPLEQLLETDPAAA